MTWADTRQENAMPLVSINLRKGRPPEVKRAIAVAVHAALVANLGIPQTDRFQLIREYESADFIHSDAHLDLTYTSDLIMLEITFVEGRSDEIKKARFCQGSRQQVSPVLG